MITNPITMDSGGRMIERQTGWSRSVEQDSTGVGDAGAGAIRDGTSIETEPEFGTDQLEKGFVGQVATPEWRSRIDLSQGVKIADRAMDAIERRLQQAKSDLTKIHKMFPPYPHGSEERAEFLKGYKSLRMQIDQLTIPPESDLSAQILGGKPVGEVQSELGQFPVHSGSEGLDLKSLNKPIEELRDDELPALIKDLERASGVLNERRTSLKASEGKIFNLEPGAEVEFAKLSVVIQEKFATLDISMARPETGVHQDLPFLA